MPAGVGSLQTPPHYPATPYPTAPTPAAAVQAPSSPVQVQAEPSTPAGGTDLSVVSLSVEHLSNPLGVEAAKPRLSWQLASGGRAKSQSAYQIQVSRSDGLLQAGTPDTWDTGRQPGDSQSLVSYAGPPLSSAAQYIWRVRVWDEAGNESPWSPVATWSTGLLAGSDWNASWISPASSATGGSYLRKSFSLPAKPLRATAFVSGRGRFERPPDYQGYCCLQTATLARGIYELSANGKKVGDAELEAQPTDSRIRSLYRTWDVTALLGAGDNAVGFLIGEDSDVILQINIEWPSGPPTIVSTDGTWTSRPGPVTRAHRFHGETFDARKQIPGWDTASAGSMGWSPVRTNTSRGTLSASPNEPMRVVNRLDPVKITQPAPGVFVADFGKNVSGSVGLDMMVPGGRAVTIKHGERLLNGRVNNSVIMAQQTSTFIGDGRTSRFGAKFGYAGFRYAEVSGLDTAPPKGALTAREIRSDVQQSGMFHASTALLNSLHDVNRQTQANGLHGIPEDTPTREKRGWMADAHVAAEATINNYDMAAFYTKFIQDMEDAQKPSGFVPDIVPIEQASFWNQQSDPVWSAATVLIPYYAWKAYGDDRLVSDHYESMDRWMEYVDSVSDNYLVTRPSMTWGQDWLAAEDTDSGLFQSGFYYLTAKLMAEMAKTAGRPGDAEKYTLLSRNIAEAFNSRYFDAGKASYGDSQFSNALPLTLGIVPDGRAADVTNTLVRQVMVVGGGHIRGGLPGGKYVVDALEMMGRSDIVNIMVSRTDSPGWAYMLTNGPGSVWEDWQGTQSLNHPMFTFIDNWLYTSVAGISPSAVGGYRVINFDPQITGELKAAQGSVQTPFGDASIAWTAADRKISYDITVPVGATGKVRLRNVTPEGVAESGQRAVVGNGITSIDGAGTDTIVTLGSGTFHLTSDPALTRLVAAATTSAVIDREVSAMAPSTPRLESLRQSSAGAESRVGEALNAYLRLDGQATNELRTAIAAARTFTGAVTLARSEGLDQSTADSLALRTASTVHQLSAAVDASDVIVTAAAVEEHIVAGGSTDVTVTVKNTGDAALTGMAPGIDLPRGWSARLTSRLPETIQAAGEARATYTVTAPEGSTAAQYPGSAYVSFVRGQDSATRSSGFNLGIGADLAATGTDIMPAIMEPGGSGFAAVTLRNLRTSTDRHVRVVAASLPSGWEGSSVQAVVPAGGQTSVLVPLAASRAAVGGTVQLSVTDDGGRVLATSQATGKVRESSNCSSDTTGETCLSQSTLVLANFEDGAPTGWSAGAESGIDTGGLPTEAETGSFLGAAALRVKTVQPAPSPQWREVTYSPPSPVSTGDASALMASLRLADPVPGTIYEAKLWASDNAGHTTEAIHRLAPGAWNQLVLPTVEDGLKDVSALRVGVRSTTPTDDAAGFFLDSVQLEYGHGGLNLAAGATASASTSVETGGWGTGNLVDSKAFSTATNRGYRSEATGSQWIQLDLGGTRSIGTVYLHPVTTPAGEEPLNGKAGMPASPEVQVSVDGTNWTTADTRAHRTGVADAPLRLSFSAVDAKFIRVTSEVNSGHEGFLSLSEVEVFGPGNTVPGPPEDRTVEEGEPARFDTLATGEPGHRLQWQRSTDGGAAFQDIPGAIGTTLVVPTPRAADDGDRFRATIISGEAEVSGVSQVAILSVHSEPLAVSAHPDDLFLAMPDYAEGRLKAAVAGAGKRLQWQSSSDGGLSWRNIPEASNNELTVSLSKGSALPSEQFRLTATNLLGARVASRPATVNLGIAPGITPAAVHAAAFPGQAVELTVKATGSPSPTITWFRQASPDAKWDEVATGAGASLSIGAAEVVNGSRYRAVAQNAFGSATGADITVSVLTPAPLPPEANSPVGEQAAASPGRTTAETGANVSPLLPASILLLMGCLLLAVQRLVIPRRPGALSRKRPHE